jgi:hypothetical protein
VVRHADEQYTWPRSHDWQIAKRQLHRRQAFWQSGVSTTSERHRAPTRHTARGHVDGLIADPALGGRVALHGLRPRKRVAPSHNTRRFVDCISASTGKSAPSAAALSVHHDAVCAAIAHDTRSVRRGTLIGGKKPRLTGAPSVRSGSAPRHESLSGFVMVAVVFTRGVAALHAGPDARKFSPWAYRGLPRLSGRRAGTELRQLAQRRTHSRLLVGHAVTDRLSVAIAKLLGDC